MNYSLEKISTVAGCDTLLTLARKKKHKLEHRKRNMSESIGNFTERIDRINNELASVQLLLKTFTTVYDSLPEGCNDKVCINVEVKRLEVRKAQLDYVAVTCNVRALLVKQVYYNRLHNKVSVMNSYIAAVQHKRTALLVNTALLVEPEERSIKNTPSKGIQIPDEDTAVAIAVPFSAPTVVHAKQQTKKNEYSSHAHFSGFARCMRKLANEKKDIQRPFSLFRPALCDKKIGAKKVARPPGAFIRFPLKPVTMDGVRAPREYL